MFYNFAKTVVFVFCRLLFRIRVEGKENIPDNMNFMICCNHISNFDPIVLGGSMPFTMKYMAKSELFKNRLLGGILNALGVFSVKRGSGDFEAIKKAVGLLKNGEIVAIFPEGTCSRDGKLKRGKHGAVLIATKARVGILPTAICGKYGFMKKMTVKIGKYIDLSEFYYEKLHQEDYQRITDEVLMKRIEALLSE